MVPSSPLEKRAQDLLNFCAANLNQDTLLYQETVYGAFIDAAISDERFDVWSDSGVDILDSKLDEFLNQSPAVPVPIGVVKGFVEEFIELMNSNVREHWVVLPILGASMASQIEFDNFAFLPGELPREEKIRFLARKSLVSERKMLDRANHTERTRSPDFYKYPLMCHMVRHHSSWIQTFAAHIALFNVSVLHLLINGLAEGDRHELERFRVLGNSFAENHHVLICSERDASWGHAPLWVSQAAVTLNANLDWLNMQANQQKFTELVNMLGYTSQVDSLGFRFRRAINFFGKSVDSRGKSSRFHEGFAEEILFLMIAAESSLLERENEKRLRLSVLLSRLISLEEATVPDVFRAIENMYSWRSGYVHSGRDVFPEFEEDFREGKTQERIKLVRRVVARFITNAPNWIRFAQERAVEYESVSPEKRAEEAWLGFLKKKWQSILAGDNIDEFHGL